jgi:hypothetical protein
MSTPPEGQPQGIPTPADLAAQQLAREEAAKAAAPDAPADGEPATFSRDYVHELREEAKRYRQEGQQTAAELEELRAWRQEQELAALSAEEQAEVLFQQAQERAETEAARAAEFQLQYEVALRAGRLGIRDPSDAVRLLDWDALEFNEVGDVTNMDDVLTRLMTAKPYLKSGPVQAITPAEVSNPGKERAPGAELTIEQIRRMTPQEINARWSEVQAVLATNGR